MLTQQKKWNRRQFQAILLAGLMLSQAQSPSEASSVQASTQMLVEANNALALSLLRVLDANNNGKNHFLSPFSIQSALSMTAEGARGETAAQMGKALQYPEAMKRTDKLAWDMTQLRSDFRSASDRMRPDDSSKANQLRTEVAKLRADLSKANEKATSLARENKYKEANAKSAEAKKLADRINELSKQVDQYELTNANSLWIDQSFKISSKYQSVVTENYRPAAVIAADFRNKPEAERLRINQWVSDQTREKIRDILSTGTVNTLTRLVIANAIYFKGTWATPFNPDFTKPKAFTLRDQTQITTPLMSMNGFKAGKYAAFNADGTVFETPKMVDEKFEDQNGYPAKDGYQVAELTYNGDTISMVIFLPTNADGLDTLLRTLSATQISTCASQLEGREFHLGLPKFKMESTYDLVKPLKSLGMELAFDSAAADFSGLSEADDPELHIAAVFHKAFVDVNEKGTEAAAATVVLMEPRSAIIRRNFIPRFVADRPFLFVIREKASGLILFIGKVEKPAL